MLIYTLPGSSKLTATKCLPKDSRLIKNHLETDIFQNTDDVEEGVFAAVVILVIELILVSALIALQCKSRTGHYAPHAAPIVAQAPPRPLNHDIDWEQIRI